MEQRITHDVAGVAIPRPESYLVARFGPSTRDGLDLHAVGPRQKVHRKLLRAGNRVVMARLPLGGHEAVFGVRASALVGRIVPAEELWGDAATRPILDRLADARSSTEVEAILESAIAERVARAGARCLRVQLAVDASARLTNVNVNVVAEELGVSERHLRRAFRETVGVSPKTFAKLARFRRALRVASADDHTSWASVAVAAGYYDQAHLITEFRAISGVTPRALLRELREYSGVALRPR